MLQAQQQGTAARPRSAVEPGVPAQQPQTGQERVTPGVIITQPSPTVPHKTADKPKTKETARPKSSIFFGSSPKPGRLEVGRTVGALASPRFKRSTKGGTSKETETSPGHSRLQATSSDSPGRPSAPQFLVHVTPPDPVPSQDTPLFYLPESPKATRSERLGHGGPRQSSSSPGGELGPQSRSPHRPTPCLRKSTDTLPVTIRAKSADSTSSQSSGYYGSSSGSGNNSPVGADTGYSALLEAGTGQERPRRREETSAAVKRTSSTQRPLGFSVHSTPASPRTPSTSLAPCRPSGPGASSPSPSPQTRRRQASPGGLPGPRPGSPEWQRLHWAQWEEVAMRRSEELQEQETLV